MITRTVPPDEPAPIPWSTLVTIAEAIGYDADDVYVITARHDVIEVETSTGWVARHPVTYPPTPPDPIRGDPPEQ